MTKSWRMQAIAACALIAMMFALVGGQAVRVRVQHARYSAQAEERAEAPAAARWATVTMAAPTHDGPGLRYQLTGSLPTGAAVEVVRQENGYSKCLTWMSADAVWVNNEYLDPAE